MEINKSSADLATILTANKLDKSTTANGLEQTGSIQSRSVQASPQSTVSQDYKVLSEAHAQLSQLPEVDLEKVNQLRHALQDGSFDLDLEKTAAALLTQHGKA